MEALRLVSTIVRQKTKPRSRSQTLIARSGRPIAFLSALATPESVVGLTQRPRRESQSRTRTQWRNIPNASRCRTRWERTSRFFQDALVITLVPTGPGLGNMAGRLVGRIAAALWFAQAKAC